MLFFFDLSDGFHQNGDLLEALLPVPLFLRFLFDRFFLLLLFRRRRLLRLLFLVFLGSVYRQDSVSLFGVGQVRFHARHIDDSHVNRVPSRENVLLVLVRRLVAVGAKRGHLTAATTPGGAAAVPQLAVPREAEHAGTGIDGDYQISRLHAGQVHLQSCPFFRFRQAVLREFGMLLRLLRASLLQPLLLLLPVATMTVLLRMLRQRRPVRRRGVHSYNAVVVRFPSRVSMMEGRCCHRRAVATIDAVMVVVLIVTAQHEHDDRTCGERECVSG